MVVSNSWSPPRFDKSKIVNIETLNAVAQLIAALEVIASLFYLEQVK